MIPYGFWPSLITADAVSKGSTRYSFADISENTVYWIEERPEEEGRSTLFSSLDGKIEEITPFPYSVRSRVHEYGGKPYTVHQGIVYFVNFKDQILYKIEKGEFSPLTDGSMRLADFNVTEHGIFAVGEKESDNFIVKIDSGIIARGHDFYASPVINVNGALAYVAWDHPNMPWDTSQLFLNGIKIEGEENESIQQPKWSEDGILYYISDRSGFWNIYRHGQSSSIYPLDAEFGVPLWLIGASTYGFYRNDLVACFQKEGKWSLVKNTKIIFEAAHIQSLVVKNGIAVFIASYVDDNPKVLSLNLETDKITVIRHQPLTSRNYSKGEPIAFPTTNEGTAYGFYYPPKNQDCHAPVNTKPPLIVKVHGGPTAECRPAFSGTIQYWTNRGFAVVDVNYRGSTGYGRAYRDLLKRQWGIFDREDCESAALYLIQQGHVDSTKIFIEGASAGGYTVLSALTFGSVFAGGASYFGVSDLALLAKETHKFESRYLDQLLGTEEAVYKERSPVQHVDRLKYPVIFFQGLEDKIVPPNQAKVLYEVLKKRGILAELVLYPGEHHGFCKAATIKDALTRELKFYQGLL